MTWKTEKIYFYISLSLYIPILLSAIMAAKMDVSLPRRCCARLECCSSEACQMDHWRDLAESRRTVQTAWLWRHFEPGANYRFVEQQLPVDMVRICFGFITGAGWVQASGQGGIYGADSNVEDWNYRSADNWGQAKAWAGTCPVLEPPMLHTVAIVVIVMLAMMLKILAKQDVSVCC